MLNEENFASDDLFSTVSFGGGGGGGGGGVQSPKDTGIVNSNPSALGNDLTGMSDMEHDVTVGVTLGVMGAMTGGASLGVTAAAGVMGGIAGAASNSSVDPNRGP